MPTPGQEVTRRGVQRGSGSFLMRRRRKREQSYYLREDGRRLSCYPGVSADGLISLHIDRSARLELFGECLWATGDRECSGEE